MWKVNIFKSNKIERKKKKKDIPQYKKNIQ